MALRNRSIALGAVAWLLLLVPAWAEEPLAGHKFMPKEGCRATSGNKEIPLELLTLPFTVREVAGDALVVGRARVNKKDVVPLAQAVDYYTELLRNDRANPWAYACRGIAHYELGDYDSAMNDCNQSNGGDPKTASACYNNLGNIWERTGKFDRALASFEEVLRLDPQSATAHFNRATAWHKQGDLDQALADYNKAIELSPDDPWAYNNRGLIRAGKGDIDGALADYGAALRVDPQFSAAYNCRGLAWAAKSESQKALADFREAIRLDPRQKEPYLNRASVFGQLGRLDEAVQDYTEVIRRYPNWAQVRNECAWLRACSGDGRVRDGKLAIVDAVRACELTQWKDAVCIGTLAAAKADAGKFAEAVTWQTRALELAGADLKQSFGERLELYTSRKPCRASRTDAELRIVPRVSAVVTAGFGRAVAWPAGDVEGRTGHLYGTSFSPTAARFLAFGDAGPAGAVGLWDSVTGEPLRQFRTGRDVWFSNARFLPDGEHVVTAYSNDKDLFLWERATGKLVHQFQGHTADGCTAIAVSHDGRRLASNGKDDSLRLWDVGTLEQVWSRDLAGEKIARIDFSPDDSLILTSGRRVDSAHPGSEEGGSRGDSGRPRRNLFRRFFTRRQAGAFVGTRRSDPAVGREHIQDIANIRWPAGYSPAGVVPRRGPPSVNLGKGPDFPRMGCRNRRQAARHHRR